MLLMAGQADAKEKYADRYLEARYNLSNCRYEYGIAQSTTEKKKQILDTSKAEIVAFVSITAEIPDVWWDKFDKLYQNIQKDMGAAEIVKLERPEVIETTAEVAGDDETTVAVAKAVPAKGPTPQPPPPTGGWIWGVLGILVAVGAAVGFYFMIAGQDKKRRAAYANAPPAEMPRLRTEPTRPKARAPQARKPQPKGPEAAAAAAKKPAAAKPAPSKPTAQPKPKPSNPQ
jgi:hypothetical protein